MPDIGLSLFLTSDSQILDLYNTPDKKQMKISSLFLNSFCTSGLTFDVKLSFLLDDAEMYSTTQTLDCQSSKYIVVPSQNVVPINAMKIQYGGAVEDFADCALWMPLIIADTQ